MRRAHGFTLLEMLVALAVIAIALTSALRALGGTAQSAAALRTHTLASWVAQDRLAGIRAERRWPAPGRREGRVIQAGQVFVWREQVTTTPNPLFRRVEISVRDDAGRPLISLTGYATRMPR
jgi:general secretion pathway protein I